MSSSMISDTVGLPPSVSMPVTIVLISFLLFIIVTGFCSLFFWQYLLKRLLSTWNLQRTPYGDLIRGTNPPANTGLDPIIVQNFPVFSYSKKDQEMECTICLSEFLDKDTIRLISTCRHAFHSSCIDLWFESHKTCPVCRCELDPGQISRTRSQLFRAVSFMGSESRRDSMRNTVTITIQDSNNNYDEENPNPSTSSSKRLKEASIWRFSRSHSTGHFMVKTDVNVKIKRGHYQTGSCGTFEELNRYDQGWLGDNSIGYIIH